MAVYKYKVGDRVRIKTWDQMAREFGICGDFISCNSNYLPQMGEIVQKLNNNRILTIQKLTTEASGQGCYIVKESIYNWSDDMIAGLEGEMEERLEEKVEEVIDRFELMDI